MNKLFFSLICILIIQISCTSDQSNEHIPGSYKGLELMTAQRAYPNIDIPNTGYYKAYEYSKKTFSSQYRNEKWTPMGPLNTAGRTLSLAINPQNDQTLYLGSASGGLWRSYQMGEGQSWEHVETGFPVLGVSAIVISPTDSMVMYIGTGEVYNYQRTGTGAAYRVTRGSFGIGILKSTDGGVTWEKSLDWTYAQQRGIQEIKISPSDPSILYAATTHGVYKSVDAGTTWGNILDKDMATDLIIHPTNSNKVIAAFGNLGSEGRGIFTTENGGDDWVEKSINPAADFQGKIQMDNVGDVVYASIGNGFRSSDGATWLFKSTDFGNSWTFKNDTDYSRWQGWFAHDVAINPHDTENAINIGIDVWASTDGGNSLMKKSTGGVAFGTPEIVGPDGPPSFSHSDHHVAMYHPNIPNLILLGNDGGLYKSEDNGETFRSANGGLQTTQFYNGFSVSHQRADFAMGGLQDNSTSIFRGDGRWQRAVGGDGSWTAVNYDDDNFVFASSQVLNVYKSDDNGQDFSWKDVKVDGSVALFIAPYVISPANTDIMYAGGFNIYKSTNAGETWSPTTNKLNNNSPAFCMSASHQNQDVVYVGTAPFTGIPEVYVTHDGGFTWEVISDGLPDRFPVDIAVDPQNDAIAYVTFSGFNSGHIFRTIDYGITWVDITGNLPDLPTNAIEIDPRWTDHLYLGNDLGVYFSPDGGDTWEIFNDGITDVAIVMDLKVSPVDDMIWVATHGRGTYKRDLVELPVSTSQEISTDILLYPNPASSLLNIDITKATGPSTVSIYSTNGKLQKQFTTDASTKIDISDIDAGLYLVTIVSENYSWSEKLIII